MRDEIFRTNEQVGDFAFDSKVASVFDDMLERSVPYYSEVQRMVVELARHFLEQDGTVYDIGCSTGTTLLAIALTIAPDRAVRFVGVEPSSAMRERTVKKLAELEKPERVEILSHPIEGLDELPDARVITMLWTLQFVRPMHRLKVLRMCQESLYAGGCLILAEKILAEEPSFRRSFVEMYHDFKRRSGYDSTEIARKRESLENVLIPYTGSENILLLREAGFAIVEPIFQWYNFAAYLAIKG